MIAGVGLNNPPNSEIVCHLLMLVSVYMQTL